MSREELGAAPAELSGPDDDVGSPGGRAVPRTGPAVPASRPAPRVAAAPAVPGARQGPAAAAPRSGLPGTASRAVPKAPEASGTAEVPETAEVPGDRSGAPQVHGGPSPPPRRGLLLVAALAALVVGTGLGWSATAAWDRTADGPEITASGVPTAVVTGVQTSIGVRGRTTLELIVRVANPGPEQLTVAGVRRSFTAGDIDVIETRDLVVPPRGEADAAVRATVACASPRPLRLPELLLRTPGRPDVGVPLVGDGRALVTACESQTGDPHVLDLVRTEPDGRRLRMVITSASGRTTVVNRISAGSVPLAGRPLPATVDAEERTVWLDPPAVCPPEWLADGLPRTVDLEVDAGAEATVTLDLRYALARWLRAGPCAKAAG